ncbi:MAG: hypothetical protein HY669_02570 [Chloroflexi bacterium]|nr:hypothetical protein [Chloroflexota bacterium]
MAKWSREKLNQRLEDLRLRLSRGETLEQIARAWGTTKQNVSQFRKRYLGGEGRIPAAEAEQQEQVVPPRLRAGTAGEDYSLYTRAYQAIMARDKLIQELETQLRDLKYRLYMLQMETVETAAGPQAKENLRSYLDETQS